MKQRVTKCGTGLAAFVAALILAAPVAAECYFPDVGGQFGSDTVHMPANSSSQTVRVAYQTGNCTIKWGLHDEGKECRKGFGKRHMTVEVDGINYHIFDYTVRDDSDRLCTTGYNQKVEDD
jgi:hypothetical protein